MSRPILITGFNPFGGATRNPSQAVIEAVAETESVRAEVLPTEFDRAGRRIVELLSDLQPAAWIGFGLHEGATGIVLERQAFNLDDARIPDNAGDQPQGRLIVPGGPEVLPSTLPLDRIAAGLQDHGIPVTFSDSAGRFVCNHVFYRALSTVASAGSSVPSGFVHLPWPIEWGPSKGIHEVGIHVLIDTAVICIKKTRSFLQIHPHG
jgi:pyroglutamyl-peptidase